MASNSTKKSKSSGMRILWIPGRKSHPKGHYSATNKNVTYTSTQKKSEVWSLGGSKAQTELIDFPSPESIDNASTSSLAIAATTYSLSKTTKTKTEFSSSDSLTSDEIAVAASECATLPATPIATTSSSLSSPLSELAPSTPSTKAMTSPIVVTTVEIRDLHNILNPDDLPKISLPHTPLGEATDMMLNSSAGTTASIETTSSPSTNRKIDGGSAGTGASSTIGTNVSSSPNRNKYKNHNNNQEDINSIKSISSFDGQRISSDFGWIDDAVQERNCNDMMHKNKRKKSKKARDSKLQLDQIDAKVVEYPLDAKLKEDQSHDNDSDEKVVKCLYYSLMCCDCTIS
ncbi:uncharacterized protein [Drosophila tropicalis]|uniref:uncharacterized protein isoform X1 n=2 Tax=Drosophila tropicalis TaxID=46794 RepID=UPI0035AB8270